MDENKIFNLTPEDLSAYRGRIRILRPAKYNDIWQEIIAKYLPTIPRDLVILLPGMRDDSEDTDGECRGAPIEENNEMYVIILYEPNEEMHNRVLDVLKSLFNFQNGETIKLYCELTFLHEYGEYFHWFTVPDDIDDRNEELADLFAWNVLDKSLTRDEFLKLFLFDKALEFSCFEKGLTRYKKFRARQPIRIPGEPPNGSGDSGTALTTKGQIT